jgi:outer membrane protein assembly factor BamD (BamD/ComL family)
MAVLNSGNNTSAASLFGAFLGEHPRDPRAEDAAYLRVIALQRAGELRGMKRAAAEYLSRHPSGFRRAEIEPLAR